jgi:hypothetical protein
MEEAKPRMMKMKVRISQKLWTMVAAAVEMRLLTVTEGVW